MDASTVKNELQKLEDVPVRDWVVEEGTDSTGDDAFWVWAILADEDWPPLAKRNQIRETVRAAVERLARGAAPWVYVRFRVLSEAPVP
jgi:hypothetical protein